MLVARIDRLAEAQKVSRSAVIKRAILEATVPENTTAIADEHEVLVLLSEAARGGSVSAMKAPADLSPRSCEPAGPGAGRVRRA